MKINNNIVYQFIAKGIAFSILLCGLFVLVSCGEDKPTEDTSEAESVELNTEAPAGGLTPANELPAGAVAHFICPNNCEGSGGSVQGNCPVCGTAYEHNKAYHNQPGNQTPTTPELVPMNTPGNAANPAGSTPPPPTASPAQNAAGVWHFTCSAGCAGGAGKKGPCSNCGQELSHNQAYHQ